LPIYEYRCKKSGEQFEKIQKFDDPPLEIHEGCGGALEQLLHPPALQFKGSGFYITDYARKPASAESSGSSATSDSGSKASDSGSKTSSTADSGSKAPASTKKD